MKVKSLDLELQYHEFFNYFLNDFAEVFSESRFIKNKSVNNLEKKFAELHNVPFSVAVSSGTSALYTALMVLDIKAGDEVITSPFTFIATANIIHERQAKPVFVDIDSSFNLDTTKIEGVIRERTKAIIPVHLFGLSANMDPMISLAKIYNLKIVEDACQAHLAEYKGEKVGGFGEFGCFSSYPAKNLGALGDGGFIVSKYPELEEIVRLKANNGIPVKGLKYLNETTGLNFRFDELKAAFMLRYTDKLEEWTVQRRTNASVYRRLLSDLDEVVLPLESEDYKHSYHQFTLRVQRRNELREFLTNKEIETFVFYPVPLHLLKAYSYLGYKEGDFPEAEKASKEVLSIPVSPTLTLEEIQYVADNIRKFYKAS